MGGDGTELESGSGLQINYEHPEVQDDLQESISDLNYLKNTEVYLTRDLFRDSLDAARKELDVQKELELDGAVSKVEEKQIKEKYKRLEKEKKLLSERLMDIFGPLEAYHPRLTFTTSTTSASPSTVPGDPDDDTYYDPDKDRIATTEVTGMTITIVRPHSKKETKKLRDLLDEQERKWLKIEEYSRQAADSAYQIKKSQCASDMYAQLSTTLLAGDVPCQAFCGSPEAVATASCSSRASQAQLYAQQYNQAYYNGGGLLKNVSQLSDIQKERGIRVATLVVGAATVWAIVDMFRGKKWAKAFLLSGAVLMAGSYIHGGKAKWLTSLTREALGGGPTYDAVAKKIGLEMGDLSTPPPSFGLESLMVARAGKVLGPLSYRQLYEGGFIQKKGERVCLVGDGKTAALALYWQGKGKKKEAEMAQSLYLEQLAGLYHIDMAAELMGNKDALLNDTGSNRLVATDIQAYQQKEDLLNNYLIEHQLVIDQNKRTHIEDYLSGKTHSIRWLVKNGAIMPKTDAERERSYMPLFYPPEQYAALNALDHIRKDMGDMTVADFVKYGRIMPESIHLIELDRAAMAKDPAYKNLFMKHRSEQQQRTFEAKLNIFFSQILAVFDNDTFAEAFLRDPRYAGGTMETLFADYHTYLTNFAALGERANEERVAIVPDHLDVTAFLWEDFGTDVAKRNAAIEALLANEDVTVFYQHGYEELQGVVPNARFQEFLDKEYPTMPGYIKKQYLMWGSFYQHGLGEKARTIGSFKKGNSADEIVWVAHGEETTINRKTKKLTTPYGSWEHLDESAQVSEVMQMAHFTNFLIGTYRWTSKSVAPLQPDGGGMDFQYYDNVLEGAKDIASHYLDWSEEKIAILKQLDTHVLSEEGMRKFFPGLLNDKSKKDFIEFFNKMESAPGESLWHIENGDLSAKKGLVTRQLNMFNKNRARKVEIVDIQGSVVTIKVVAPKEGSEIKLDIVENQISPPSPLIIGDLGTAVYIADALLGQKNRSVKTLDKIIFVDELRDFLFNTQAGGNTANTQAGGNTGNTQAGGNTANTQAGGNTANTQAGGNTANTQAGGNTANTQAGGNTANTQAGGNTANTQAGGNTANTQAGGNTANTQAGGNTANTQTDGIDINIPLGPILNENPNLGPILNENPNLGPILNENPNLGPILNENPNLGPILIENPNLGPILNENPNLGPILNENPNLGPILNENPNLGPILNENPNLGPILNENPNLGPILNENPNLGPILNENPNLGPILNENPNLGPILNENPNLGPILNENPNLGPILNENPNLGPILNENPNLGPILNENPNLGPILNENPNLGPILNENPNLGPILNENPNLGPILNENPNLGPILNENPNLGPILNENPNLGPILNENPNLGPILNENPNLGPILNENPNLGPILNENPNLGPILNENPNLGPILNENPNLGPILNENPNLGPIINSDPGNWSQYIK